MSRRILQLNTNRKNINTTAWIRGVWLCGPLVLFPKLCLVPLSLSLSLFFTFVQPIAWVQWRRGRANRNLSGYWLFFPLPLVTLGSARTRDHMLHVRMCVHALFSISLSLLCSRLFLRRKTAGFQIDNSTHVFIIDDVPLGVACRSHYSFVLLLKEAKKTVSHSILGSTQKRALPRHLPPH